MESPDYEVFQQVHTWLVAGQRVWLATLLNTWGAAPRPVGSLLAVGPEGRIVGSLSGGCIEEDLVQRLPDASAANTKPLQVTYGISAEESRRFGLPCGGRLDVVVEPLADTLQIAAILEALKARERIVRHLDLKSGTSFLSSASAQTPSFVWEADQVIKLIGPAWQLILIGAGQLSKYVAQIAQALGYHVVVCDPRSDYAQQWQVSGTDCVTMMPDDLIRDWVQDSRSAVVALTHDPRLDDMALMEALESPAFYVGALGSQRSQAQRRERLASLGLSEASLRRLQGPVGLPIGSHTPPEIAISILAELTAVRNGCLQQAWQSLQPLELQSGSAK